MHISSVCIHQAGGVFAAEGWRWLCIQVPSVLLVLAVSSKVVQSMSSLFSCLVCKRSRHDCGLLVLCRNMTSAPCPAPPVRTQLYLKLLTSSTADSIGVC